MAKKAKTEQTETPQEVAPALVHADMDGAISHLNEIAASIQDLKSNYGGVQISGPDDKANADIVQAGYSAARTYRLEVERRRKDLIAPALAFQRGVNEAAEHIKNSLEDIEKPLKAKLDAYEQAKAEAREAKRQAEQARIAKRSGRLFELGATFNGNIYQLGTAVCLPDELAQMNDDQWIEMVAKFNTERDAIQEAKRREAEAERQRQEEEMQRKEEQRQREQELRDREAEAAAALQKALLRERAAELKEVGFVPYFEDGKKAGMWLEEHPSSMCSVHSMRSFSADEWSSYVQDVVDFLQGLAVAAEEGEKAGSSLAAHVHDTVHEAVEQFAGQPVTPALIDDMTLSLTVELDPRKLLVKKLFTDIRDAFEASKSKADFRSALDALEADYMGAGL